MGLRLILTVIGMSAMMACTASAPPTASSATAPDADPGPPPAIPTTEGATLTLSGSGVSPKQVRVYQGTRVTFVNQDSADHEIQSNPLHLHTDCPAMNSVGFIVPGQSRLSDPLPVAKPCGFHDHTREGDAAFYGTVFVDPR
jgi:plastocyanin